MDENTWRLAQVAMWLVGIQTTLLIAVIGAMWASLLKRFDRIDSRFEKLETNVVDIDKRVFGIETMLHMKDCCVLKADNQVKKAE